MRAPLGSGVKHPHGVDLIVEKLTADRLIHLRGEYVQNPAAHGELSRPFHFFTAGIARRNQARRQIPQIRPSARGQRDHQRGEAFRRQGPLDQRVRRRNDCAQVRLRFFLFFRRVRGNTTVKGREAVPLPFP